jgi:hypothetical protein
LKERCPSCGQVEGVPLVWGDPDEQTRKAAQRSELVLAGCMIQPLGGAAPDYACLHCCHRWISQDDTAA